MSKRSRDRNAQASANWSSISLAASVSITIRRRPSRLGGASSSRRRAGVSVGKRTVVMVVPSDAQVAAVEDERRARDVGGVVGEEVDRGVGDFVGTSPATERDLLVQTL